MLRLDLSKLVLRQHYLWDDLIVVRLESQDELGWEDNWPIEREGDLATVVNFGLFASDGPTKSLLKVLRCPQLFQL